MAAQKTLDEVIAQRWKLIASKLTKPMISRRAHNLFSRDVAQLFAIFLIFTVVFFTHDVIEFSQTVAGHLVAVGLIFYFTTVHPMVGAIISMFFILFYNSNLVRAYYYDEILFRRQSPSTIQELYGLPVRPFNTTKEPFNSINGTMETSSVKLAYPFTVPTTPSVFSRPAFFQHSRREGFKGEASVPDYEPYVASYDSAVDRLPAPLQTSKQAAAAEAQQFREQNCSPDGQLEFKGVSVPAAMTEHIFPNLKPSSCNPCDPSCTIRYVDQTRRLETDRSLRQGRLDEPAVPESWLPTWFDVFLPHPVFPLSTAPFAKPSNFRS